MILKNKVFIITGATSGMGKSIALQFAKEGAILVINGRNNERGNEVLEILLGNNKKALFVQGDVGKPAINEKLVKCALETFGRLDGIIANAGILGLGKITDISINDWQHTFDTNFNSFFYLSKFAIPHIIKQKGVIIANASIAAFKNFPNHPAYCASKAAMVSLVKQMALDYGPNIRVNAICPGPVDTPLIWDSAKAFDQPREAVNAVKESTPLRRLGSPEDIAELAVFLASEKSSWMTGSAITIDGGIMVSH
ncbi:SDR family NAD(P)-dependent oxidoreductase [Aquimarina sp. AU474]|uniref:SDR family NAD(P)-dependent oxidoreductase n=1 Tax=Aquimarina sp. AU474 TaxID=2108529 RepID=UPI000D69B5C3|nr:SDR family oxidoreductase [Aquimarina sp. AU474]